MGEVMELNGVIVDRDTVRAWLRAKHVALWSDWLVGDDNREQDLAIDWLMSQMGNLSAFAVSMKPTDGPGPGVAGVVTLNGHKTPVLTGV